MPDDRRDAITKDALPAMECGADVGRSTRTGCTRPRPNGSTGSRPASTCTGRSSARNTAYGAGLCHHTCSRCARIPFPHRKVRPCRPHAHSANPAEHTHNLEAHLTSVAGLAATFARLFGSEGYAQCAGLWDDLGKNAADFHARLAAAADAHVEDDKVRGRVDHSSAGAVHAVDVLGRGAALPVAFAIADHHAGLADLPDLNARLADPAKRQRLAAVKSNPAAVIPPTAPPALPVRWLVALGPAGQSWAGSGTRSRHQPAGKGGRPRRGSSSRSGENRARTLL
jgi:hypothetical protein